MHQEIIKIIKPKEGSSLHFTKKMELAGRKVVYKGMCAISILIGLLMIIHSGEASCVMFWRAFSPCSNYLRNASLPEGQECCSSLRTWKYNYDQGIYFPQGCTSLYRCFTYSGGAIEFSSLFYSLHQCYVLLSYRCWALWTSKKDFQ